MTSKKRYKISFIEEKKIFTLTSVEGSFGTESFWLTGGGITDADVDETVDVRRWLSSSSARFFIGAWENRRCDRKSSDGRCWPPRIRKRKAMNQFCKVFL